MAEDRRGHRQCELGQQHGSAPDPRLPLARIQLQHTYALVAKAIELTHHMPRIIANSQSVVLDDVNPGFVEVLHGGSFSVDGTRHQRG